ncbi:hypothetical protein RUM43_014024 [Polyplax serrata]|uniref:Uncharacterized protein n=1 Tax=Polyplax serrata TaxID=468196 RepID=A0AAN8PBH8_POLSC
MSGNGKWNLKGGPKGGKVSAKGLRHFISAIGRKIFSKVHKTQVEYGQTLSKKRRKNCVLKSVSALSCPVDEDGFLIHSPYRINFRFARDDSSGQHLYQGSVNNFQRINPRETCCEKCDINLVRAGSLTRFSLSSDSACDVSSSQSSCDEIECAYRQRSKSTRERKCQSSDDITRYHGSTVETFIRIHSENFKNCFDIDSDTKVMLQQEEDEDHSYESLEETKVVGDSDYDILLTKSGYHIAEPFYENFKVVETAKVKELTGTPPDGPREPLHTNKNYDDVIESLKIWHMTSRNDSGDLQQVENTLNHCLEGYESLENEFNNDIEVFCSS